MLFLVYGLDAKCRHDQNTLAAKETWVAIPISIRPLPNSDICGRETNTALTGHLAELGIRWHQEIGKYWMAAIILEFRQLAYLFFRSISSTCSMMRSCSGVIKLVLKMLTFRDVKTKI